MCDSLFQGLIPVLIGTDNVDESKKIGAYVILQIELSKLVDLGSDAQSI